MIGLFKHIIPGFSTATRAGARGISLFAAIVLLVVMSPRSVTAQVELGPPRPPVVQEGWAMPYPDIGRPRQTSSGERYAPEALTAAHRTLPVGTSLELTSLLTGRRVVVRVNDKGPFVPDRIVDISAAAARELGFGPQGGTVRLRVSSGRVTADAQAALRLEEDQPRAQRRPKRSLTGEFTVQLGSFEDEAGARKLSESVEGGWVYRILVDGKWYYRVNFGVFSSKNEAEKFRTRLAARGVSGFVKAVEDHEKRTVLE